MTRTARAVCIVAGLVLLCSAALFGATALQVDRATRPVRQAADAMDLELLMLEMRDVAFRTADGVRLAAWMVPGRQGQPAVVVGHEFGGSKAGSTGLARSLTKEGYTLLLVDLRGHGESGGTRSTLGVHEKRDLLAALEFLRESGSATSGVFGLYGVGMSAHAAVLAAAEAPAVKVLVLDGLYPDALYPLTEALYPNWEFGRERLGFMPASAFRMLSRADVGSERAADVLADLLGRELLLLAPERDVRLSTEMKRMYRTIPQQRDVDGNFVLLPATRVDGLYGDALGAYHERVTGFFRSRLRAATHTAALP